jgi:hypothetical protein
MRRYGNIWIRIFIQPFVGICLVSQHREHLISVLSILVLAMATARTKGLTGVHNAQWEGLIIAHLKFHL